MQSFWNKIQTAIPNLDNLQELEELQKSEVTDTASIPEQSMVSSSGTSTAETIDDTTNTSLSDIHPSGTQLIVEHSSLADRSDTQEEKHSRSYTGSNHALNGNSSTPTAKASNVSNLTSDTPNRISTTQFSTRQYGASASAPHVNEPFSNFSAAVSSWITRVSTPIRHFSQSSQMNQRTPEDARGDNSEQLASPRESPWKRAWKSVTSNVQLDRFNLMRQIGPRPQEPQSTESNPPSTSGKGKDEIRHVAGSEYGLPSAASMNLYAPPQHSAMAACVWAISSFLIRAKDRIKERYTRFTNEAPGGFLLRAIVWIIGFIVSIVARILLALIRCLVPDCLRRGLYTCCGKILQCAWNVTVKQCIFILILLALMLTAWMSYESLWTFEIVKQ